MQRRVTTREVTRGGLHPYDGGGEMLMIMPNPALMVSPGVGIRAGGVVHSVSFQPETRLGGVALQPVQYQTPMNNSNFWQDNTPAPAILYDVPSQMSSIHAGQATSFQEFHGMQLY
jgi:hypothetical protein